MKKKDTYKNDDIMHLIDKWFEEHQCLTKSNYEMIKDFVYYMRNKQK